MNVHVSYKVQKTPDIEKEINHQIEKMGKRLQVFRPELIHLKAILEQNSPREGTSVSLNLRLPSGQLAAQQKAPSPAAAIKSAFDDLLQQLIRHKELLRSSHKWRRWRSGPQESPEPGVPFEKTLAAVLPATVSADDIGSYVNANLSRLVRFVDRELYFRHADDELPEDGISTNEVVDEVIARALGDGDPPEKLALEPWLYRLAMQAMDEMSARLHELESPVCLEDSRRKQNVLASDEPGLQYHQADEGWTRESTIADRRRLPNKMPIPMKCLCSCKRRFAGPTVPTAKPFFCTGSKVFPSTKLPPSPAGIRRPCASPWNGRARGCAMHLRWPTSFRKSSSRKLNSISVLRRYDT
jgi:ribosome-associated translation inhibitor RaiA